MQDENKTGIAQKQAELKNEIQSRVIEPISMELFKKSSEERDAVKAAKKSFKATQRG